MKNLKRALSFALASVMLIGMMVVGAGAATDFTDADKIEHSEAVSTMVTLGVIAGKEDGTWFAPQDIVSRAEMAKMIAVTLNGGKDPVLGTKTTPSFTDIKGTWAESYIEYCASLGIIAGRGDGTFDPTGTVTATEAAKMILVALGYNPTVEGYTGGSWAINTNVRANQIGLYDELSNVDANDGMTRDDAAQMLYNALVCQEVWYTDAVVVNGVITGDSQLTYRTYTLLTNRFGVVKVEGVVVSNEVFGINGTSATLAGKARIANSVVWDADNGVWTMSSNVYPVSIENELVGSRVVIYVKYNNPLSPNAAESTVLGEPVVSAKNTVVDTSARLKDADAVKNALKGSGIAYTPGSGNVETYTAKTSTDVTSHVKANGVTTAPGVRQRFIDNTGDGKVDLIIREIKDLAKVTVYNTKDAKLTLSGIGSIDFEDIVGYEDVAKDDYVLVIKYDDTYYIEAVDTEEGTVTAYTNSTPAKITMNGVGYAVSAATDYTNDLDGIDLGSLSTMVDDDYCLYLDDAGNAISAKVIKAAIGDYAVITAKDVDTTSGFEKAQVKLVLSDGTKGTYTVNLLASAKKWSKATAEDATTDAAKEAAMASALNALSGDDLVAYAINEDGTVTLSNPAYVNSTDYGTATGGMNNGAGSNETYLYKEDASYKINTADVVADNSTVFFIKNADNSYSIVTGLKSLSTKGVETKGNATVIFDKSGATQAATALRVTLNAGKFASTAEYAYVSGKYTKTIVGGEDIYTYPVVLLDGTTDTISLKGDASLKSGYVYAYTVDTNGYATKDSDQTAIANNVFVYETGNNTVSLWDADDYDTDKGTLTLETGVKVWNVEDTTSIYDTTLAKCSVASYILNKDKTAIEYAFVSDVRDSANKSSMAPKATVAYSANTITVTPKDGETVTIVWKTSEGTFEYVATANDSPTPKAQTMTATGLANDDEVKITVAVKDKVTRTYTDTVSGL